MASPPLLVNVMVTVTLRSKDASAVSIVATNAVLWQACAGKVSLSDLTLQQCLTVYTVIPQVYYPLLFWHPCLSPY